MRKYKVIFLIFFHYLILGNFIYSLEEDSTTSSVQEILRAGRQYSKRFFFFKAKEVFAEGLKKYPDDWELNKEFIYIHLNFRQVYSIIPDYIERTKREPENPVGFAGAAICNLFENNLSIAESLSEKAKEIDENSLPTLDSQALVKQRLAENNKEIMSAYERLLEKYPNFNQGYIEYLSWLLSWRKLDKSYIKIILEWSENNPSIEPYIYAFDARLAAEELWFDPHTAIDIYKKILNLDPYQIIVKTFLARSYADVGEIEGEERVLKEIVAEAPDWAKGWLLLSLFYKKLHKYDLADECLTKIQSTPFQESEKINAETYFAQNLYISERFDEAIETLNKFIKKYESSNQVGGAKKLLTAILSRKKEERINIIDNVPYLTQKGNYCGPATLSMVLGFWGVKKTQDEIASIIYTGVVGTAPQTIEAFCKTLGFRAITFRGDIEIWKKLLEQNIPILWLQQLEQRAHYMIITGYDDISKVFILHNPHFPFEASVNYRDIDDEWIFPSLRRSLIIVSEARLSQFDLSFIKKSLSLEIINYIFYFVTGSNLFKGFFPEVLWNLIFSGIFVFFTGWIIQKTSFPYNRNLFRSYVFINFFFILGVNYLIYKFHYSKAVSITVCYHLALGTFTVALLLYHILFYLVQDYFTCGEMLKIGLTIFAVFLSSSLIEYDMWQVLTPLIILFMGTFLSLRIRFVLLANSISERHNNYTKSLTCYRKYGREMRDGKGLFHSRLKEIVIERRMGNFEKARDLTGRLISEFHSLTRYHKNRLRRFLVEFLILENTESLEEQERYLNQANQIYLELKRQKLNQLELVYLDTLFARLLIIKNNYIEAKSLAENAQKTFDSTSLSVKCQKLVETIRGAKDDFKDYNFLNSLNLLFIAKNFNDKKTISNILEKFRDKIDLNFIRNLEMFSFVENRERY